MIALAIIGCDPGDPPQPVPTTVVPNAAIPIAPNAEIPAVPNMATPVAANMTSRTIWDGVYTEEQRRRGEAVYTASCVRCHGEELEKDDVVPELVGEIFLNRWSRKRAGNLFAFMKAEMPPKARDRLTPPEYADVLAYLLSRNQAPVGEEELASNFEALQAIRMTRSD